MQVVYIKMTTKATNMYIKALAASPEPTEFEVKLN